MLDLRVRSRPRRPEVDPFLDYPLLCVSAGFSPGGVAMKSNQAKKYDPASRRPCRTRCARESESLAQIGQRYRVHRVLVGQWKRQLLKNASLAFFRGRAASHKTDRERDELLKKIGELTIERAKRCSRSSRATKMSCSSWMSPPLLPCAVCTNKRPEHFCRDARRMEAWSPYFPLLNCFIRRSTRICAAVSLSRSLICAAAFLAAILMLACTRLSSAISSLLSMLQLSLCMERRLSRTSSRGTSKSRYVGQPRMFPKCLLQRNWRVKNPIEPHNNVVVVVFKL
jgi:transposase